MNDSRTVLPIDVPLTAVADELVVYLPHQEMVAKWLGGHGTPVEQVVASDARLGLARLRLALGDRSLDTVLKSLRAHFEGKYHDWVPMVGKNRHMAGVIGQPETRPHTAGRPVAEIQPREENIPAADPTPVVLPVNEHGRGVRVGILDTKIFDHPDLTGRFVADHSALWRPAGGSVLSRVGHATFIAGMVLQRAPAAELHVADVLDDVGNGTVWELATKLMAMAEGGLDVVNLSLGSLTMDHKPPLVLRRAIELVSQRVLVIASAGNHGGWAGGPEPMWPAALPDVVAVGATGATYSPKAPWVTCTAPGEARSTYLNAEQVETAAGLTRFDGYATWAGTSFAAAAVTAAVAANTVPGQVSARQAMRDLLDDPDSVVIPYVDES